jgi:N-carbamoylputrescine amidase
MKPSAAPSRVQVSLLQTWADVDPASNRRRTASLVHRAADEGANIVCLQELFTSQYFCHDEKIDSFDLAEPIDGPSVEMFAPIARDRQIVIILPFFEKRSAGLYHNSAVILDADGSTAGMYRKMHIPHDPHFYEKYFFTPGDLGFKAIDTRFGRLGILICWDQWFPEGARLTAMQGAEILFYPTAIGWLKNEKDAIGHTQHSAWETVQRGHAIANSVYVAATNRVGIEGELEFWGQSFACDPTGSILAKAGQQEEIVSFELDRDLVAESRRQWPFLRDRRVDAYQGLTQRFIDS